MQDDQYGRTKDWPYHISCGGVIYKDQDGQRHYALLLRRSESDKPHDNWHLPKGTLKHNETLEQGALREIREESGLTVEIRGYLGALHAAWTDRHGINIDKTTHYFLCEWRSGDGSHMDDEHDALEWYLASQAIEKLKLEPKNEAEVIKRAEDYLSGPVG